MITVAHPSSNRRQQRGPAALAVALVLLFGMTLVAFFASRGMIFEQRTSANQYRSTRAFELAEAGLEWAVARLNDPTKLATAPSCASGTTVDRFADRYLPVSAAGFTWPARRFGCSIAANGAATCSCPTTNSPTLPNSGDPRFTVEFVNPGGDPWSVEIISSGCTSEAPQCNPGSTQTADAVAVVRALYKMKPSLPNAPGAGLVTGSAAVAGGNLTVINLDVASNGITINSGTAVDLGNATNVITLPGTPPRASVLDNDPSLASLSTDDPSGDKFFASFFGETMAEYQNNPEVYRVTSGSCPTPAPTPPRCAQCNNANSCGTAVSTAYTSGFQKFWVDADASWTTANTPAVTTDNPSGTLGTATRPIIVASPQSLEMKSNMVAYGMFYAATATATENWDYSGSGTAKVFGSFVSRGNFNKGSGTLDLIYAANLFFPQNLRGVMVRVPGSWRDKSTAY